MAVKLIMTQQSNLSDIEVEIRYSVLNEDVNDLVERLNQKDEFVGGMENGRKYRIRIPDIYYAESVDKKTFIYTRNDVFRCELRLYQLLDRLRKSGFVQVNRNCIVNINVMDSKTVDGYIRSGSHFGLCNSVIY